MNKMRDEVVSSESELLIQVDEQDNIIGTIDKSTAHDGIGTLHRAFSAFIFNANHELLMQKRAEGKRLWSGFWSNSCCSHPRWGEDMDIAIVRRIEQELGITADLEFLFKFVYQATFSDAGSEHELCSVYAGIFDGELIINKQEIAECRWLAPAKLDAEIAANPENFTPWMKQEWRTICSGFPSWVGR